MEHKFSAMTDSATTAQRMRVAVLGAGAMGSFFGAALAEAGEDVTLYDGWIPQIEAIRAGGVCGRIMGRERVQPVAIRSLEEAQEPADLVIVFVKALQLEAMLPHLERLTAPHTQVLCLLNGVGHARTLGRVVSAEALHMGVTMWAADLVAPGRVDTSPGGEIHLQNAADTPAAQAAAKRIVDLLNRGSLQAKYSENVKHDIWHKACVNGTSNTLCTLLDTNLGGLFALPQTEALLDGILLEFCRAAALEGVRLDPEKEKTILLAAGQSENLRHHYPSMHQDLIQNRRRTEVDYLNGAVADLLEQAGEAAPINRFCATLVHAREALLISE